MMAYNRLARIFVIAYRLHHAGIDTTLAAYALMRIKQYAAAFSLRQCARRAYFGAIRLTAGVADCGNKPAG
jgi:hypothetical protein